MTIPNFETMKLPILSQLNELASQESLSADQMRSFVREHFALTDEDIAAAWKHMPQYSGQMLWALTDLAQAGLIERPGRGAYRITEAGRKFLSGGKTDLSRKALMRDYPAFAQFMSRSKKPTDKPQPFAVEAFNDWKERYKEAFADQQWANERYKWEAIKQFQDSWDLEADDFGSMLEAALSKTGNLLVSANNFPRGMIIEFARLSPNEVRAMFRNLFDESTDVVTRIENFKQQSDAIRLKLRSDAGCHYQTENVITTYLWLRYPDKYYIYKFREVRNAAERLGSSLTFKQGQYENNLRNFLELYDSLHDALRQDPEMRALLNECLDNDCYADPDLRTLTSDFGFFVSRSSEARIDSCNDQETSLTEESDDPSYSKEDFLSEVFLDAHEYDKLERVLRKSKNLILQGAPGTGKTFAAKKLAYAMMGTKDDSRIELVQFHQSYSYEDFVMGFKPEGDTFELKKGVFYRFCEAAESHPDREYFFIIDEINRGNMSKVFGELLMLIEASHRGDYATLSYSGRAFAVPENLYIIGMMNTADRSLAMIDYALRRRFAFYEMKPAFESAGFKSTVSQFETPQLKNVLSVMKRLNQEIEEDPALGKGFRIGHSYFCNLENGGIDELTDIIELEIVPMLEEYWFDDADRIEAWQQQFKDALR